MAEFIDGNAAVSRKYFLPGLRKISFPFLNALTLREKRGERGGKEEKEGKIRKRREGREEKERKGRGKGEGKGKKKGKEKREKGKKRGVNLLKNNGQVPLVSMVYSCSSSSWSL